MKSYGNGNPEICVLNIVSIVRGQAPYLRGMGLDGSFFDKPTEQVKPLVLADVEDQIETYEERVRINDVDLIEDNKHGFKIVPDITIVED